MKKTAVILCGGQGVRLRPYTITIPKPLMPLGDHSILDVVVEQLKRSGFERLILAVNYRSDLIKAYFQDGKSKGVEIEYVEEDEPLGTIGPIRNIKSLPEKFLVINGDILSDLDLGYYYDQYNPQEEFALVPVYQKQYHVDFGVIKINNDNYLEGFQEKPKQNLLVSMGAYFFSTKILEHIPSKGSFGFDQLMHVVLEKNLKVKCPIHKGFWLDIGRHDDYTFAQDHYADFVESNFNNKKENN